VPGKLEATPEIFEVVPFQEDRQLGIAEHREFWIRLGCVRSPRPRSLQVVRQSGDLHSRVWRVSAAVVR